MAFPNPLPDFPTDSKKVNFSPAQEVLSTDLNTLSTYLHQIIKDFNINVFGSSSTTTTSPSNGLAVVQNTNIGGAIVSGMAVTGPTGGNMVVAPGLFLCAISNGDSSTNYSGTLVNYLTSSPSLSSNPAGAGNWVVGAIDITYTEVSGDSIVRNFYDLTDNTVDALSTFVDTKPNISTVITWGTPVVLTSTPTAPALPSGATRLATFFITNLGIVSSLQYVLPYIWNLQNWPNGDTHTFNPANSQTLSDSLSAIRAEIVSILGPTANWYDTPATTIAALNTQANTTIPNEITDIQNQIKLDQGTTNWNTAPPTSLLALNNITNSIIGSDAPVVPISLTELNTKWLPYGVCFVGTNPNPYPVGESQAKIADYTWTIGTLASFGVGYPNANKIFVRMWGAGGGSGGDTSAGGGGGYVEGYFTINPASDILSFSIGGGGANGHNSTAGTGGNTGFYINSVLQCYAGGGSGGTVGGGFNRVSGGTNSVPIAAQFINIQGGPGTGNTSVCIGGSSFGGPSVMGDNGDRWTGQEPGGGGAGSDGSGYGAGGANGRIVFYI
jgi:hypothetical protein